MGPRRFVFLAAAFVLPVPASPSPAILVTPVPASRPDTSVVIEARARVSSLTFHVLDTDGRWIQAPAIEAEPGVFRKTLAPRGEGRTRILYWVEAEPLDGGESVTAGSPDAPFFVTLRAEPGPAPGPSIAQPMGLAGTAAAVVLLAFAAWEVRRRERERARGRREAEFWRRTLAPLRREVNAEFSDALTDLCSRDIEHPTRGRIRATRGEALAWFEALKPTHRDAGFTLPELLVVIALVGLAAGAAALSFGGRTSSAHDGAGLVEAAFGQARASAMASTSAYRVRAVSSTRVIAETAPTCGSALWATDAGLGLTLPQGLTLAPADFQVCFNGRGLSDSNLIVVVSRGVGSSRSVEVLLGGTARVLP